MQTILGANGTIGVHTAKALVKYTDKIRLVSRNPGRVNQTDILFPADLRDPQQTLNAVKGSQVVYLTAGLTYNTKVWEKDWPLIMNNVIQACKEYHCKLVFFDNVYAYGRVDGWMHEDTPFNPNSKKGEIRARIATQLLEEIQAENIQGLIARSADFYGPNTPTSFVSLLVFDKLAKAGRAQWMIDDSFKHSFTYTPDAGKAFARLGNTESAYGQSWHLPTHADVMSGKEWIELAATAFAVAPKYLVLKKWMMKLVGNFDPIVKEMIEMLYQLEGDYLFNSSKYEQAFQQKATSYKQGVVDSVASYL